MGRLGGAEPGVFLYPGDLIEALVRAELVDEALPRSSGSRVERADRPDWGHAVAARGRGLLAESDDEVEAAFARALSGTRRSTAVRDRAHAARAR